MMNIILLSGGSGKRLWPLSNETRSKQFLKLMKNENSVYESMIQRVYRQIKASHDNANVVIATGKAQADLIKSQLNNKVDVVLEPERRDTFPAIALASSYFFYKRGMDLEDVLLVLPVDPFADKEYFEILLEMEKVVRSNIAKISLMGIKPTYPSAKYGYITPKQDPVANNFSCTKVASFHEKPSEEYAEQLIQNGAVWNGGVFAFRLGYLIDKIREYVDFNSYEELESKYSELPKISFDYEIVEKELSIAMVEYQGVWKDLGTWNTLTEVMDETSIGKVIVSEDCINTHVINELDIPIIVLGGRDLIVAASPDGILISDKHQSSYLKPYVDTIHQRPMYEERRWGEYKVIDYVEYPDGTLSLTKHLIIKAGKKISYQSHYLRDEVWTFVDGFGELTIDGHVTKVKRGDVVSIGIGTKHTVKANSDSDLRFIEVQIGSELSESDIRKYD